MDETALSNQKPILGMIRQQVKRLSVHIDKVLELGSLESEREVLKFEKVDFRPYLLNLCKEFATLVTIEKATFTYHIQEGEFILRTEVFHLENTINNILDNAKKYADNPIIQLNAFKKDNWLVIEIGDNGQGISLNDQKKIFLKYYRVTGKERTMVKGYGLGLSYVKNIVEKHKGKVEVKSEVGKGTQISLLIPLCNE